MSSTLSLRGTSGKLNTPSTSNTPEKPNTPGAPDAPEVSVTPKQNTTAAVCDASAPLVEAPPEVSCSVWKMCGVAVTGLAHLHNGHPCQDAVAWSHSTRPIMVLSDGAGSAPISERGAGVLVRGIRRFFLTMEDDLANWLDEPQAAISEQSPLWAQRVLFHAKGLLDDLAETEQRRPQDARATLLLAVLGRRYIFWWQVGDGAIVVQSAQGLQKLGNSQIAKGEFANQTCFVDTAQMEDVQFGVLPTAEIFGLALMSDGGAERIVSYDGQRVADRLRKWFDQLTQKELTPDQLALAFFQPDMWERTTKDDRSIVLAARPTPTPEKAASITPD